MININITVGDLTLELAQDVTITVDEKRPVKHLVTLLVRKMKWPEKTINGHSVSYALRITRNGSAGSPLSGNASIDSIRLLNGDVLLLGPMSDYAVGSLVTERSPELQTEVNAIEFVPLDLESLQ